MSPTETSISDLEKNRALIEMFRAVLGICQLYGLERGRVKQMCDAMIELHDWKDER